jgi:ABC-2 type transport system ATP-binding protein
LILVARFMWACSRNNGSREGKFGGIPYGRQHSYESCIDSALRGHKHAPTPSGPSAFNLFETAIAAVRDRYEMICPMPMIEVSDLRKVYGTRNVVDGVSFSVEPGEIFGILGPNGAGKTTAVECIGGLRRRDGGTISVDGMDPAKEGTALRDVLGIQLQESRLPDKMSVIEALDLYSSFYREPHNSGELLERLGLVEQRTTYFAKLSGGQKQRLSVALALIGNPRVAILDELTTGLDPVARREVWELLEDLRETGVTLLLVSHFMEEAERLCDRVIVIDHGRVIASDTPESLAASVHADQRMSFLPSVSFDHAILQTLPEVHAVATAGERVIVTGSDDVASAVIIALHERGISVGKLRVDQPSLDDAFVALTSNDEEPSVAKDAVIK